MNAAFARRPRGFTLIELMIVVAIIAIIAAVAVPSYQDSVWKGKRGEAKAAMLKALQAEERYYSQNNTYVAYTAGSPPAGGAFPGYSADSSASSRYNIAAVTGPLTVPSPPTGANVVLCPSPNNAIGQCVIVKATVIGTGADPNCGVSLYMDSIGNKGMASTASPYKDVCWK